VLSLSVSEL
jgi:iron-sulfur cluster assembly accessory protein